MKPRFEEHTTHAPGDVRIVPSVVPQSLAKLAN